VFTHTRASWQDPRKPVTGPLMVWRNVDTIAIHYTAADNLIDGDPGEHASNLPAYMRSMQSAYLSSRGYSLGYNVSVDWLGGSWEIRGVDIRCAANKGWNERTFAILMLVDGDDMATTHAAAEVRRIVAECERLAGRVLRIAGHGEIGATACPGSGLRAQITIGEFSPRWNPAPPPPPPVLPPPTVEESFKMLTIVGNDDNRDDPRRWVFDGGTSMRLLPNEEAYAKLLAYERVGMVKLYPFFSTLASPHWMSTADRAQFGCA
jgi:hypothetical protein